MSESKTYVFGENGTSQGGGFNSILAMLPALMQRQGVDPSLFALCNGKSNGNGWGDALTVADVPGTGVVQLWFERDTNTLQLMSGIV